MKSLTLILSSLALPPAALAALDDIDIPYEEFRLDNGLRVIVHEDHKAPLTAVTVWYHVGSKDETPGRTGFAHLFEHLMFNGSENYDGEYFTPFQEIGATSINGTTDFDRTNYFQTVPSTGLDLALWMESDRMGHMLGAIDQEKLDEQRGVVQNEKRQSENRPYGKVFEHIVRGIFPESHPYSWLPIGSMEDLDAASLDDVRQWFGTYYGPNNATLVIAGDVEPETVRAKVERYFGDIPPGPPIARQKRWLAQEPAPGRRIVIEDRVPQARLYKVWPIPEWSHPDTTLLGLVDEVLTGSMTSRMYRRLVYEEQVATDVGAFPFSGEIAGAFVLSATAQPGQDLAEIERLVEAELERFLAEGPTQQELERVKTQTFASFVRGVEQVGGFRGKSNILAESAVLGGRPDFYRTSLERVDSASREALRDTALRWLSRNALTLEVRPYEQALRASGDGVDRSEPPMPETFPEAPFPALEQATLQNGMRLIVAERRAVPVVQFSLQMNAGYTTDARSAPGTAKMAMEMLDEGTATRGTLEISEALDQLGAELRTGSNLDTSFVSLSALTENLEASLDLYADVVLNPSFPEQELARLKRLAISEIQQEKTSPMTMGLRVLPRLLFGEGHAYSLPMTGSGTEAAVEAMTRDALMDFHRTWFKPNNATMIVVGDTTLAEIEPRLEALFGRWEAGATPDKHIPAVALPDEQRVFLINRPGSEQSIIIAGHVVTPKSSGNEEIAIQAMNDILGGSFTSRINMNLREDKAWSYGARSTIIDTLAQRPLMAYAPVQADQTAASMREIALEFSELTGARPATEQEVATSKRRATLSLPGRWETARAVAGDIAEIVRFDLPSDYWQQYPERVRALQTSSVNSAAGRTLEPDRLTWIVVGDLTEIRAEVEALELGTVTVIDAEGLPVPAR